MKLSHTLICLLFILMTATEINAQKLNLIIGTYTKDTQSEGIYVYEFDTQTGKTAYKNKYSGLTNPSYLTLSKDEKFVYAISEAGPGKGAVNAFSFDKKSGSLVLLNSKPSVNDGPCYVSTNAKNDHVFMANYRGGGFTAIALNKDGSLTDASQNFKYTGNSVNKVRQDAAHAHSCVLSPDEKFIYVSDLGTDKINIYKYDKKNPKNPLSSAEPAFISVTPGSGPRHFEFHPNGKFAYSIQELSGNIGVFAYKNGDLEVVQNISAIPEGFDKKIWGADIHLSPDGKFLYASFRDDLNDLAIFSIDETTGKLSKVGRQSTMGTNPRNFVIEPSGQYLLAANQNSNNIVVFKRDKTTGLLTDTGERITIASPVCLKFSK